jgi:hypothetical protein
MARGAGSPAAPGTGGCTPTTSCTGRRAAAPTWTTWLVCGRHHTLIHQHGFVLVLHRDRSLTVTADGVPVLHHPGHPWRPATELDPRRRIDPDTLPPDHVVGRIDLGYAVMVLAQQSA